MSCSEKRTFSLSIRSQVEMYTMVTINITGKRWCCYWSLTISHSLFPFLGSLSLPLPPTPHPHYTREVTQLEVISLRWCLWLLHLPMLFNSCQGAVWNWCKWKQFSSFTDLKAKCIFLPISVKCWRLFFCALNNTFFLY